MRAVLWFGVILATPASALAKHGIAFEAGTNVGRGDHVPMDFYRASYKRDWDATWFNDGNWYLKAHSEFSVIRLIADVEVTRKYASSTLTGVAVTPVFRYTRVPFANGMAPYIELGVGISYFSGSRIQSQPHWYRDYGSHFQFEDRLSLGVQFKQAYSLSINYTHYSNFDFAPPNEGLDLVSAGISFNF